MHLFAFEASNSNAALAAIAAVADAVVTPQGANRFIVPSWATDVKWAAALGTTIQRAQIITPSLSQARVSAEIHPRRVGTSFTLTAPEIFIPMGPMPLVAAETLEFDIQQGSGGAEIEWGLVELGPPQLPAVPAGQFMIARGTGTKTLVANAWTLVPLTLDFDLPVGNYALVGFLPMSANAIAARASIVGQTPRPGVPALKGTEAAATDFQPSAAWKQTMGYDMGHFNQANIPQFEFLSSVADTAEEVYLYLIRLGGA